MTFVKKNEKNFVILRIIDSFRVCFRRISGGWRGFVDRDPSRTVPKKDCNVQDDRRLNIFLQAFIAGTLSALAFAPFDLFVPMVISVSWLYILLEKSSKLSRKKVFLVGLAYGSGYFLAGNYWISISLLIDAARFGWLLPFSVALFSVGLGLFFGFFLSIRLIGLVQIECLY